MKKLLAGFLVFSLACVAGFAAAASKVSEKPLVVVSPSVELALVIAGLSGLDRTSNNSIDREDPYFDEVEAHFQPVADHPVFQALGDSFNLPRLAGNAADYAFDDRGELIKIDDSGSLWGDTDNNLFANHLSLIQDFATRGDFLGFYAAREPLYNRLIFATSEAMNEEVMTRWLHSQYTIRPGAFRLFVSPLLSGFHWTTLFKPEQRIWLNPPDPDESARWSVQQRMSFARAVFTELDHAYVNPVTTTMLDEVTRAFSDLSAWGTEGAIRAYSSPELVFNEYMTWAVFLLFAQSILADEPLAIMSRDIVRMMENGRGFTRFGDFATEASRLFTKLGLTAEELQPLMVEWADRQH